MPRIRFITLFSGDIAAMLLFLYISFSSFHYIRFDSFNIEQVFSIHSLLVVACMFIVSFFLEIYDGRKKYGTKELLSRIGAMTVISLGLVFALYGGGLIADKELKVYSLTVLFFSLFQIVWHGVNHGFFGGKTFGKRVVILGDGALAKDIGDIVGQKASPYDFLGYISIGNSAVVDPGQIVGESGSLSKIVRGHKADAVVVSIRERRGAFPAKDLLKCKMSGIEVYDAPTFYEKITGKLLLENISPSGLIFSDGFRITPVMHALKRALDIVTALFGLIILLPFIPIFALLVVRDSPGPILFSQTRVGERGALFTLYKFRTMRMDAEKATGAVWAQENDPRITRLGRIYRKLRIDEIPQLWNILRGDMSFVGPRPERPEFVESLSEEIPYYSERHAVKPGLTGWAQVSYRYGSSVEDAREKLRFDMYYIKKCSIFFDLYIILKTAKVIVLGAGR